MLQWDADHEINGPMQDPLKPRSDTEKREIVRRYEALRSAIDRGDPDVMDRYRAFREIYRGARESFIETFATVSDQKKWVGHLHFYLRDEIELSVWIEDAKEHLR